MGEGAPEDGHHGDVLVRDVRPVPADGPLRRAELEEDSEWQHPLERFP